MHVNTKHRADAVDDTDGGSNYPKVIVIDDYVKHYGLRLTLSLLWYLTSVNRKFIFKFSSGQTLLHQARFHKLNRMVLFRKFYFE